mmetsp:Transcript_18639/g.51101  ORF Transcript_18639/g.51101 Transcript_18639/m.51101 type:complete len:378 (+) Transcript_18639:1037-2170(+)
MRLIICFSSPRSCTLISASFSAIVATFSGQILFKWLCTLRSMSSFRDLSERCTLYAFSDGVSEPKLSLDLALGVLRMLRSEPARSRRALPKRKRSEVSSAWGDLGDSPVGRSRLGGLEEIKACSSCWLNSCAHMVASSPGACASNSTWRKARSCARASIGDCSMDADPACTASMSATSSPPAGSSTTAVSGAPCGIELVLSQTLGSHEDRAMVAAPSARAWDSPGCASVEASSVSVVGSMSTSLPPSNDCLRLFRTWALCKRSILSLMWVAHGWRCELSMFKALKVERSAHQRAPPRFARTVAARPPFAAATADKRIAGGMPALPKSTCRVRAVWSFLFNSSASMGAPAMTSPVFGFLIGRALLKPPMPVGVAGTLP